MDYFQIRNSPKNTFQFITIPKLDVSYGDQIVQILLHLGLEDRACF